MENRNGLVTAAEATWATATAEHEAAARMSERFPEGATLGANKGYDAERRLYKPMPGAWPSFSQRERLDPVARVCFRGAGYEARAPAFVARGSSDMAARTAMTRTRQRAASQAMSLRKL